MKQITSQLPLLSAESIVPLYMVRLAAEHEATQKSLSKLRKGGATPVNIDDDGEVGELGEAFFKKAKRGRPPKPETERKVRTTIMLDPDVVEYFKADGRGWQTRINAALRKVAGLDK